MAVQMAKKPVPAAPPVKPALVAVPPKPAPVAETTSDVEAAEEAEEKAPRLTRKDFATWEEFCDYKMKLAQDNVAKWTERVGIWQQKKLNKDADSKEKMTKKCDKLIATWIETQIRIHGVGAKDKIMKAAEQFRANLEAAGAGV